MVDLACSCGTVRGTLEEDALRRATRCVCYCHDCQSYAHFLGDATGMLDVHGGTEILQLTPAPVMITEGWEQLACMRLTDDGLLRWYARCCRSPVANTLANRRIPFVGLFTSLVTNREAVESVPLRARVFEHGARGELPPRPSGVGGQARGVWSVLRILAGGLVRREARKSPFFDPESGKPACKPYVLSERERKAVEAARGD